MASQLNSKDYVPKRLGLQYDPPTIILEYLVPSSGKLYHHKMKLAFLTDNYPTDQAVDAIKNQHALYIMNQIPQNQLVALVEKLQKRISARKPLQTTSNNRPTSATSTISGISKANTSVSTNSISGTSKGLSPIISSSNNKLGSIAPIKTDIKPANTAATQNFGGFEQIEDPEDDDYDVEEDDYNEYDTKQNNFSNNNNQIKNTPTTSTSSSLNVKKAPEPAQKGGWDQIQDEEQEDIDYNNFNLNKLSNEELQKHKDRMNKTFAQNAKQPGDKGYVYDKQEDFRPSQSNEWDQDEDIEDQYDDGDIV